MKRPPQIDTKDRHTDPNPPFRPPVPPPASMRRERIDEAAENGTHHGGSRRYSIKIAFFYPFFAL
jgi:hypothetical protein